MSLDFDHTVLAELLSRHWQADRPYFAPNRAGGVWLAASWERQAGDRALALHWRHRSPPISSEELPPSEPAKSLGSVA